MFRRKKVKNREDLEGDLLRRDSFKVGQQSTFQPKSSKQLLRGIFNKPPLPGGLGPLPEAAQAQTSTSEPAFAGHAKPSEKSFDQLYWPDYFDAKEAVSITKEGEDGAQVTLDFNLYTAGGDAGPLVLCVHGGGYTALTWALVAKRIKSKGVRVAALDLRGHGESPHMDDMSSEALATDVCDVWNAKYGQGGDPPPTVLLGHSLGGAVAIKAAKRGIPTLAGLIVMDVVEGTALASLPYMSNVIAKRPTEFKTVNQIVQWAFSQGSTRNFEAARVSHPSQFRFDKDREAFVWITDLHKTEPFWKEWYTGLSAAFLSIPAPKLLLLAGTDRLDKELTIGHMQGKFQMKVLPTGHAIQEDDPDKTSEAIMDFVTRYKLTES